MILLILFLAFSICGCVWCYHREKKDFNNGICPHCGTKLKHFDNDSHGGEGWCCDECGYFTWISWFKGKKEEK